MGQSSLLYEKMAILFNLGALFSLAGLRADRNSPDYAKVACGYFQHAAWIFEHVQEVRPKLQAATTSDLSEEGLGMCVLIMLAQAQGLFYLKCLKTPAAQLTKGNEAKKSSICAKLAAHASKLYMEASEKAETPALKAILNKAWLSHANFQQHLYGAAAAFKQSEALHAKAEAEHEGFGLEIAWLVRASNLIGKANEVASSRSSGLTDAERESAGSLAIKYQPSWRRGGERTTPYTWRPFREMRSSRMCGRRPWQSPCPSRPW